MADIAHIAGLVAGGAHPSPVPHCAAVTTTTHKTLRGPRGGLIMSREAHAKAIDKAVFPGLQGGPHNHSTAAKAVAFAEASTKEFSAYAHAVVANAKALAEQLMARGHKLITGGTDNHLMLVDLTQHGISGRKAGIALNRCGIELNGNSIPFDPRKPFDPSGIRIGLASLTSRGLGTEHMDTVAEFIHRGVIGAAEKDGEPDDAFCTGLAAEVAEFLKVFPAPGLGQG